MAYTSGLPIAGPKLERWGFFFGRNWGCVADYKFLHFETRNASEYAIEHGLARVEAGAGPHKLQRGYEPLNPKRTLDTEPCVP